MADPGKSAQRAWLHEQVAAYKEAFPRYQRYADVLHDVLAAKAREIAPLAIIQTRPKSVASFAGKVIRKRSKYRDPVNQLTDLCGARVIARTETEVRAFCDFIEDRFEIDWDNTVARGHFEMGWGTAEDPGQLGAAEFGYRSVHYVVSVGPDSDLGVRVPKAIRGLKAEVQVRTTAEHAWADFGHDLSYKGAFRLPLKWQRQLSIIAAQLEDVDHAFAEIERGMRAYASSYGAYRDEGQLREEIETLETILRYDRRNAEIASQAGRLWMTLGEWDDAIRVLSRFVDPERPAQAPEPILRDLGVSLCKRHRESRSSPGFEQGRRYLELAADTGDPDALSSLAGTWKDVDERRAREYYRAAFEADPTDFYPLSNYLELEVRRTKDTAILEILRPDIEAAAARCRAQADVGTNLPWTYFGIGMLQLFLGEPYESLRAYAKAIQASTADWMIEGSLESLERLSVVGRKLPGYEWARRMLMLGLASRFPSKERHRKVARLSTTGAASIQAPILIVVGGTHPAIESKMKGYQDLMLGALVDFRGTVISGGTRQGVSGLVGEVSREYRGRVHALAYLPRRLPPDATLDRRYTEIRRTEGSTFSALEPLQNWIDIVASGIDPRDVKLLGFNGGDIAAIEYRIALALGASVGVIEESGREAAKLLSDEQWAVSDTLVPMPADAYTVRAFVGSGVSQLSVEDREVIARAIHDAYREEQAARWDELEDGIRRSNRLQAEHIFEKLREIGCSVQTVPDRGIRRARFTDDEVEVMAEMEHGRWNAERLAAGWRWGQRKDVARKISPYLVPWSDLSEEVRDLDRNTVRRIPEFLATVGIEIIRGE